MTRDEAKKMAEEYADSRWGTKEQARKLAVEWDPQMYDCERQETVRAYMACYDMMVSGEPDGWIGKDTLERIKQYPNDLFNLWGSSRVGSLVPVKLIRVEGSSK